MLIHVPTYYLPNHQRWYAKWTLSWNMCAHTFFFFACLGADLQAQSVLGTTKFLRRSSVGSSLRVCVVGWVGPVRPTAQMSTCPSWTRTTSDRSASCSGRTLTSLDTRLPTTWWTSCTHKWFFFNFLSLDLLFQHASIQYITYIVLVRQGNCYNNNKKKTEQPITKFTLAILVGW